LTAPAQCRARISPDGHTSELAHPLGLGIASRQRLQGGRTAPEVSSLPSLAQSHARISPGDSKPTCCSTAESTERGAYLTTAPAAWGRKDKLGGETATVQTLGAPRLQGLVGGTGGRKVCHRSLRRAPVVRPPPRGRTGRRRWSEASPHRRPPTSSSRTGESGPEGLQIPPSPPARPEDRSDPGRCGFGDRRAGFALAT
jgi:hypothetical protein